MPADAPSIAALVAAVAAVVVAGINWIASRTNQSKLLEHQRALERNQKDLRRLQQQLDEQKSERDARRDYEYEARKRLYHECSPLLFQLTEQAASALSRIKGIASSAAQGELEPGPNSWLTSSRDRYYRRSTEYRLLAPIATQRLLQQRLTRLDLSLDAEIYMAYTLLRAAARVLGDDFDLAAAAPQLAYDPHSAQAEQAMAGQPQVYRQQGIPRGILDNAVDAMIVREADGGSRVVTFLEFEQQLGTAGSVIDQAVGRIRYLLMDFHPREEPILWRVLLASASIYRAIALLFQRGHGESRLADLTPLLRFTSEERAAFDWRAPGARNPGDAAADAPFEAVEAYLRRNVDPELRRIVQSIHS